MTRGLKSGAKSMEESDRPKLSSMYIFSAQRRRCGKGVLRWWRLAWIQIQIRLFDVAARIILQ